MGSIVVPVTAMSPTMRRLAVMSRIQFSSASGDGKFNLPDPAQCGPQFADVRYGPGQTEEPKRRRKKRTGSTDAPVSEEPRRYKDDVHVGKSVDELKARAPKESPATTRMWRDFAQQARVSFLGQSAMAGVAILTLVMAGFSIRNTIQRPSWTPITADNVWQQLEIRNNKAEAREQNKLAAPAPAPQPLVKQKQLDIQPVKKTEEKAVNNLKAEPEARRAKKSNNNNRQVLKVPMTQRPVFRRWV